MLKKKIYFNLRAGSRERMQNTVSAAAKNYEVLTSDIHVNSSMRTHYNNKKSIMSKIKVLLLKFFPMVNTRISLKDADFFYYWGSLPRKSLERTIVEIDNPYVLTFYNRISFSIWKWRIKQILKKMKAVVFLSHAAKKHMENLLSGSFFSQSFVLYPFVERNYLNRLETNKRDMIINFLFVSLDFELKGGKQLLEAFTNLKNKNISLTVVSDVPNKYLNEYGKNSRIKFLPPMQQKDLFNKIYPKMDVLVYPSFYDSFGVAILEAISFGLGVIAVDNYAIPEMVKDNVNGYIIPHPFIDETSAENGFVNCIDANTKNFTNFMTSEKSQSLINTLKAAIEIAIVSHVSWSQESIKLFETEFSPEIWNNNFSNIISS